MAGRKSCARFSHALNPDERAEVLSAANQPRFAAVTPEVWCWDMTYLPATVVGRWFHLYLILDLYSSDYLKHKLWVPDFERQQRIATILTSLDNAIEATEALIEKHQQIKAGLMHDLFTRGVGADGQIRSRADSVFTKFGQMPSQWRLGSILELTDPERQPILTGPFGADLGANHFLEEGVPVLRIDNVQAGRLDLSDLLYVSTRKAAQLFRYRVREGDLLFARQGATTGRNALADENTNGSLINYHIIRVALEKKRCTPLFVEAAFASEIVKRQIERDKGRGTREGINTAQITSLQFPMAGIDEQRQISEILSAQTARIDADIATVRSLRMRKAGLMQDLLTGKVPVNISEHAIPA